MHDESVERLELKLAYLENANAELSDVVYRQQQQIERLELRLTTLLSRFEEWQSRPREWTAAEEKPPHY